MDERTAAIYRRFGELETPGISDAYSRLALAVASDAEVVDLIAGLPLPKRQANLVFGAAVYLGAPLEPYSAFRAWLLRRWQEVRAVVATHSTQTNEAGRCASLLPVLSRLEGPLALIEVGASAGLCLHPDRYSYRYRVDGAGTVSLDPAEGPSSVVLPCTIDQGSVPQRLPEVVWRAGVDLHPIDPSDAEGLAWLRALIWPEHDERREPMAAAARIAASDPAPIVRGDLLKRLPALVDAAPAGVQVVVFHTAVLVYLEPERRQQFAAMMTAMPHVRWLSNEDAGALPGVAAQVQQPVGAGKILALDGRAVAVTGPHGQSYAALN